MCESVDWRGRTRLRDLYAVIGIEDANDSSSDDSRDEDASAGEEDSNAEGEDSFSESKSDLSLSAGTHVCCHVNFLRWAITYINIGVCFAARVQRKKTKKKRNEKTHAGKVALKRLWLI